MRYFAVQPLLIATICNICFGSLSALVIKKELFMSRSPNLVLFLLIGDAIEGDIFMNPNLGMILPTPKIWKFFTLWYGTFPTYK